jgi:hypothetical protein
MRRQTPLRQPKAAKNRPRPACGHQSSRNRNHLCRCGVHLADFGLGGSTGNQAGGRDYRWLVDVSCADAIVSPLVLFGRKPMAAIDRRTMLGAILSGAAVATIGLALTPGPAQSAPLAASTGDAVAVENPVEQAVFVTHRAGRRPSRRPRTKCWYKNGKRVCSSQYHR